MPKLKHWEWILSIFIGLYFIYIQYKPINSARSHNLSLNLKVLHNQDSHINTFEQDYPFDEYAYILYATDYTYLELAMMNVVNIRKSSTKVANVVILYNKKLTINDHIYQQSIKYNITLKPIDLITNNNKNSIWSDSFTKFQVFNQLEYSKIVYFDADSMLMGFSENQGKWANEPTNLDELFTLDFDLALPQAYWLSNNQGGSLESSKTIDASLNSVYFDKHKYNNRNNFFANHIMVIKPQSRIFTDLLQYMHNPWWWKILKPNKVRRQEDYDMEILNRYLDDRLLENSIKIAILPHQKYGVLSGEFKEMYHSRFLAEAQDLPFIDTQNNHNWDAYKVIANSKLIHFSDAPIPKPWESKLDNGEYYNVERIYCIDDIDIMDEKFPTFKPRVVDDCKAVRVWEWIREEYERYRVANLDLQ